MTDNIPRRCKLYENSDEEIQIRECINAVENLGAHPLLTECVVLLSQAREKLADWIDSV